MELKFLAFIISEKAEREAAEKEQEKEEESDDGVVVSKVKLFTLMMG